LRPSRSRRARKRPRAWRQSDDDGRRRQQRRPALDTEHQPPQLRAALRKQRGLLCMCVCAMQSARCAPGRCAEKATAQHQFHLVMTGSGLALVSMLLCLTRERLDALDLCLSCLGQGRRQTGRGGPWGGKFGKPGHGGAVVFSSSLSLRSRPRCSSTLALMRCQRGGQGCAEEGAWAASLAYRGLAYRGASAAPALCGVHTKGGARTPDSL